MSDPSVSQPSIYQDRYTYTQSTQQKSPDDYNQWDEDPSLPSSEWNSQSPQDLKELQEGQSRNLPSDDDLFADFDTADIPDGYWEGTDDSWDATQELTLLKNRIQESESLSQSDQDQFLQEISQWEVGQPDLSREIEQEKFYELQDRVESAIAEAGVDRKAQKDSLSSKLDQILDGNLGNPFLPSEEGEKLKGQIEELRSKLSQNNADLFALSGEVENLSKEVNHQIKTGELLEAFKDLPNTVTAQGKFWESTQAFSLEVVHALDSGNWSSVEGFLNENTTDGGKKQKTELGDKKYRSDAYRVVQQFVGTLFHRLADGNQEKLDAFLNLIPEHTRHTMIQAIEVADKDLYSRKYVKAEGEAASMGYYGTPKATADRVRQSLEWNEALYFDEKPASPPNGESEV